METVEMPVSIYTMQRRFGPLIVTVLRMSVGSAAADRPVS
jgi:hypothetical protein